MTARHVLISGGTGAIGAALVRRFSERGDDVCFTYNSRGAEAEELARTYSASAYQMNLLADFNPPEFPAEILVNNAGVNLSGHPLSATSDREVSITLEVNLMGPLRLCRRYVPDMAKAEFGRIVNINSLWGLSAPANRLSYAISKHALRAMTMSLANELATSGITVNDICPGPVDSAMLREMGNEAVAAGRYATLDSYLEAVARDVPTGHLVLPRQVAAVAEFLATEEAANCTGLAVRVDGGLLS